MYYFLYFNSINNDYGVLGYSLLFIIIDDIKYKKNYIITIFLPLSIS